MIDINLLPPKPRAASTGLVLPVLLLLAGLAISAYLGYEYWGVQEDTAALRTSIAETEQQQAELQNELQSMGASGIGAAGVELIEKLRQQRPDVKTLIGRLEAPLPTGSTLETVRFGDAGLAWTCLFTSLGQASTYSSSLREQPELNGELIQSVKELPERGYIGTFELRLGTVTTEQAGDGE
ncbi:hypothetical protein IM700_002925 [Paenibacillus sp. DXFW5]|uniref:Fimbrial protein n=1 Tax=Paenibacillus rhizolycopersici TaxID=2780073 RepID=A0ABS2H061_9BACL|nr:hypothetical protein [Paenibacillus rhizolycopersici]MBM6994612.1 hypothetical protein [Paenibacillus rhizolycopersici]